MIVWPSKDPDEKLVRYMDWTLHPSWTAGDTIASATFSLTTAAGMTVVSSDHDYRTLSKVTLSGGTAGERGKLLCEVVTEDGQTLQQTVTILVEER